MNITTPPTIAMTQQNRCATLLSDDYTFFMTGEELMDYFRWVVKKAVGGDKTLYKSEEIHPD